MVRLLAAPLSMDQKAVSVTGYLSMPTSICIDCGNRNVLCFHKEDADNGLESNCVGVDVSNSARHLNHRYVEVQGVVGVIRQPRTFVFIQNVVGVAPVANEEQAEADRWRK